MESGTVIITPHLSELFGKALDESRVIMFSAPLGCGKTTVAHELLRRAKIRYRSFDALDPTMVEQVTRVLGSESTVASQLMNAGEVILVDNVHALTDPAAQQAMASLIGMHVFTQFVFIGRCPMPSWLMPFETMKITSTISTQDLSFNLEAIGSVLEFHDVTVTPEEAADILEATGGYRWLVTMVALELSREKEELGQTHVDDELLARAQEQLFAFFRDQVMAAFTDDERRLLLSMAVFEHFDAELAQTITGISGADRLLRDLQQRTSMMRPAVKGMTSFWPIVRAYLMWQMGKDWSPDDKDTLFSQAGEHFESVGDVIQAVRCYETCGDHQRVVRLLERSAEADPHMIRQRELEPQYLALADDEVRGSVALLSGMSMLQSLRANYDDSERWYDELAAVANDGAASEERRTEAARRLDYLDAALPHRELGTPEQLLTSLARATEGAAHEGRAPHLSATGMMPSALNGSRDLSPWVTNDEELYEAMRRPAMMVLGREGIGLPKCVLAESRFQRGEDVSSIALEVASALPDVHLKGTPDVEFATVGLLARVQVDRGNANDAHQMALALRKRLVESGDVRLLPNIDALLTRIDLLLGNLREWSRWYRNKAPHDVSRPFNVDRYQYLTKALVELADGDYQTALLTLAPWRVTFERCNQSLDAIALHVINAIALRALEEAEEAPQIAVTTWQQELTSALSICERFGYVRPVSYFGMAVLPLLKELDWQGDDRLMGRIMVSARKQATNYPSYLQGMKQLREPLTPTELKVLKLLANDFSNARIGEVLGIKLPTVKTHVSHIIAKLDVSSRAQAKTAAEQLRLV